MRTAHYQLFKALYRFLQHLAQVFGVATHRLLFVGIGRPLARLQNHPGGIGPLRPELDPDNSFKCEPGGGLPAETLCLMTPFRKVPGFEGGDQLVDLGALPPPMAAKTLAPAEPGAPQHLGMPKSSASEQVKSLDRRGFLTRHRDPEDERQLSIVLTDAGVARVRQDSILDLVRLTAALKKVSAEDRRALLTGLERLVAAADG